jgi:hypothetical protein
MGGAGEMARGLSFRHAALKRYDTEGVEMEMEMERCAFTPHLSAWIAGFTEYASTFAMSIYIRRCFMCVRSINVLE